VNGEEFHIVTVYSCSSEIKIPENAHKLHQNN
jgi:hypothetical protein